jgi:hypothetical protein
MGVGGSEATKEATWKSEAEHPEPRTGPIRFDLFFFAYFLGCGIANYQYVYAHWFYAVYFGAWGCWIGRTRALRSMLHPRQTGRWLLAAGVIGALAFYNIDIYRQKESIVPVTRLLYGERVLDGIEVSRPEGNTYYLGFSAASMLDVSSFLYPGMNLFYFYAGRDLFQIGAFSEAILHMGILPAFLAFLALFAHPSRHRWVLATAAILLCALLPGQGYWLYELSHRFFPHFKILRHMQHFAPMLLLCMILFSCLGLETFLEWVEKGNRGSVARWNRLLLWGTPVYLLLGWRLRDIGLDLTNTLRPIPLGLLEETLRSLLIGVILLYVFSLLLYGFTKGNWSPQGTLIRAGCLLLIDLGLYQRSYQSPTVQPRPVYEETLPLREGHRFHPSRIGSVDYRILHERLTYPYCYLPLIWKKPCAVTARWKELYELRDYHLLKANADRRYWSALLAVGEPILALEAAPRRLSREAFLERLSRFDPDFLKTVTVHTSPPPDPNPPPGGEDRGEGICRVTDYRSNLIRIEVDTPREVFLYYADAHHPAWEGRVDGKRHPIERANYAYKGIWVPAGHHVVEFLFRPLLFLWGLGLHYTVHAVAACWMVIRLWKRYRCAETT